MTASTQVYRQVMLECERRRVSLGLPMDKFSEYAGLPERYFSKALHSDAASGRQANWPTLQLIIDALFPCGFDLEIKARPGQVVSADNLKARLLQLRATVEPRTQRQLMRKLGSKGGKSFFEGKSKDERSEIMRKRAKKRWRAARKARRQGDNHLLRNEAARRIASEESVQREQSEAPA